MSLADWQQVEPGLAKLQSYYNNVRAAVGTATISADALRGINAQLTVSATYIAKLKKDGSIGAGVLNGTTPVATWVAVCNETAKGLQSTLQSLNEEDLYALAWDEFVVPTVIGIKDTAQQLASSSQNTLIVIAVILVALVALKVLR